MATLDEAIESAPNETLRRKLSELKARLEEGDEVFVEEMETHYEIIIVHAAFTDAAGDTYTGGAEQMLLNKSTGAWEEGWHEHPMLIELE